MKPIPKIKIERGIPLPQGYDGSQQDTLRKAMVKMSVGDSFLWPNNTPAHNAANKLGFKVRTLKINGQGYRIWLVNKPNNLT